jgi:glycosyltransferase involved in cell wall biosynthesis
MPHDLLILSRYDRLGASSRVRTYQYLPFLREAGISTLVCPLFDDAYVAARNSEQGRPPIGNLVHAYWRRSRTLLATRDARAVWIEYEALPWLPYDFERWLYRSARPVIVDYDDAVFHRYDGHRSRLVRRLVGRKIDRIMAAATIVVAGNAYLADRAKRAGAKRVEIVPSVVDLARYAQKAEAPKHREFVIGWIGSRSTLPYLQTLETTIRTLAAQRPVKVVNVGGTPWSPRGIDVRTMTWSEASEVNDMLAFDVGVMPLPDEPWARGKCGYKLIQYMACALPTVAAPVGVNAEIVVHGKTGFLATAPDEWLQALRALAASPAMRHGMGRAAFARVAERYSLGVTARRVENIVRSVLPTQAGLRVQSLAG